ncbi:MAG: adenylate/guanylate cyclase domain-containing protein [Actinobacteria bacterium]|nr:MAG: adenylate/guanylate cyclase domain-containing protein [Actinomycetota bacterium]TMM08621.1 MAG: adenylate/guanylate cyclase domain-containing protein [Actinomycetota bacterium]
MAYQAFGEGDLDVVLVNGFISHVELVWEYEPLARMLEGLGSFARVINFDRRGSGLSDPVPEAPTLEQRMEDVRAVMDAAGSERAALIGISEGASMSILMAATHPERVQALVCCGAMARSTPDDDYPLGTPKEALVEAGAELVAPHWGTGAMIEVAAPSHADDPAARAMFARLERSSASPGMLGQLALMFFDIDVRDVVPTVQVPALILHRAHDRLVNIRHGRWLADHMPNARFVELPGDDHAIWYEEPELILGEVQEFLTGTRDAPEPERVLATVLFTDIVDSTRTASELGDQRWREVLESHDRAVGDALGQFGGRRIKSTGDGFLATFDGPARAIRCARAIVDSAPDQGIRVRAGVHTGECEVMGQDIGGIGVHIAARVSALAGPDEVLVSRTVKDLVAGSGLEFTDRGEHELKGVPDSWRLFAAAA